MFRISDIAPLVDKHLPPESAEYQLIVQSYDILTQGLTTTVSQAHSRLSSLDSLRPQISAISFMLAAKINQLRSEHDLKYNKEYTRWVSTNMMPSHAAIEARIYRDDIDLMMLKYKLEDHYKIHDFVRDLVRCLDNMRQSVMKSWDDSARLA